MKYNYYCALMQLTADVTKRLDRFSSSSMFSASSFSKLEKKIEIVHTVYIEMPTLCAVVVADDAGRQQQ